MPILGQPSQLTFPTRSLSFPRRPLIMGILNINDDSFCADGSLDPETIIAQARQMIADGADCLDFGAESARTNREAISVDEEIRRFHSVLAHWEDIIAGAEPADEAQVFPPLLSANTWRPEVVAAVLPLGVELLNDMSALPDARNAELCAAHHCALLIMHSVGQPKVPHTQQQWPDVMAAMEKFFTEKMALARAAGLRDEQILLDPGLDFAKQVDDNRTVMRELERLHRFGRPLLLPVSRKTFIGEILDLPDPLDRDAGTMAALCFGQRRGASFFRVHQVRPAWQCLKVLDALGEPAGSVLNEIEQA
ncbi:MAG: dihydropteroate synthase [Verrucomicrobiales bacterium]